ncbi:MAG: hypothetical protein H9W82_18965 [Lactobacillus sp.]|nr:hypothetical protein [Lactobacillus sp.]
MDMFSIVIFSFISALLLAMIMIIFYTGTKRGNVVIFENEVLKNEKEN